MRSFYDRCGRPFAYIALVRQFFLTFILILSFEGSARPDPSSLHRRQILAAPESSTDRPLKVAFFDADSTLRVSRSGMPWASTDHDYIILPGVVEKIKELNQRGFFVAIVSNQGRIPQSITMHEADEAIMNLVVDLKSQGAIINYFDFADKVDENRKPNIGMFNRLDRILNVQVNRSIDLSNSIMVGDAGYTGKDKRADGSPGTDFSNADRLFAENAHIRFEYAPIFFGWARWGIAQIKNRFHARILLKRAKTCVEELATN